MPCHAMPCHPSIHSIHVRRRKKRGKKHADSRPISSSESGRSDRKRQSNSWEEDGFLFPPNFWRSKKKLTVTPLPPHPRPSVIIWGTENPHEFSILFPLRSIGSFKWKKKEPAKYKKKGGLLVTVSYFWVPKKRKPGCRMAGSSRHRQRSGWSAVNWWMNEMMGW